MKFGRGRVLRTCKYLNNRKLIYGTVVELRRVGSHPSSSQLTPLSVSEGVSLTEG